jgi:DNA-binding transcriptional LysR family regulator
MAMELRHLRAFVAIADEGGVSAAARVLSITQPALSRTLVQLESALGIRLFDRSTTAVTLTAAGRDLLPKVVDALQAVDAIIDPARAGARPLRVGHAWSALGSFTPEVLRAWEQAHPDVPLVLRRFDDRFAGVTRGATDLAIIRGKVDAPDLHLEHLYEESRCAVLSAGHRLAGAAAVTMADLAAEKLVLNAVSGTISPAMWPGPERPRVVRRLTTVEDWLIAIAADQGIGLSVLSTAVLHSQPDLAFVPITDAPSMPVMLAWRRGPGHPARVASAMLSAPLWQRPDGMDDMSVAFATGAGPDGMIGTSAGCDSRAKTAPDLGELAVR